MARYSDFLGRRVEVQYRAGDILLPASGTFVADSGRSIFLEQNFELHGQEKHFRWEIPYQYIVRLEEKPSPAESAADSASPKAALSPARVQETSPVTSSVEEKRNSASATAASASGGGSAMLPLRHRPKTA